jgi:ubiquinone/menaquinone biosynthesis C-methylase UbiE
MIATATIATATRVKVEPNPIESFLDILRCPISQSPLKREGHALVTSDGRHRYRISEAGVPLFAEAYLSAEAEAQRHHYNKIATAYTANLNYPHTQEYLAYLDRVVLDAIGPGELGTVAELCCGRGEAPMLLKGRMSRYIGLDISENMLQAARQQHDDASSLFLQGDATRVPLAPETIDTVVMLGGVHHVPDRARLFTEIARVLKPGGRFLYREPVSDFILWRALRAAIYRLSPMLDPSTERPLLYEETVPVLDRAGLQSLRYQTHGLLGFCLFMNSDVLFFNRVFAFVPGIRAITRGAARLDEAVLNLPGFARAGLQVVGLAEKLPPELPQVKAGLPASATSGPG